MTSSNAPCPKELTQQSVHSPGIIDSSERVAKLVIAPEHWDKTKGEIKNALIKKDELCGGGTSIVRLLHSSPEEIRRLGGTLASRAADRTFMGAICTVVKSIRALMDTSRQRCFCVHDDGLEKQPSHALIVSRSGQGDADVRRARADLLKVFSNLQTAEEALVGQSRSAAGPAGQT